MTRSQSLKKAGLNSVFLTAVTLLGPVTIAAQTQTALTPAQQKAQAAREARQAAQQQAAQNRASAAQNKAAAAQNKTTAATPNVATGMMTNSANAASASAKPATQASATGTTGTGAVGSGTLAWQTRVYSSTGCVHDGNSAVCTFTFANQGNAATLLAGAEMSGIQLVDDAHVPHRADSAHFLDKYGTQQPRLLVQPGDTGTYVLTFSNVNSQVTSGDFHLRQQIVGGVTFSSAAATTGTAGATNTPAKVPAK